MAAPAVRSVSTGSAIGGAPMTLSPPAGTAEGDVLVLSAAYGDFEGAFTFGALPAGWTRLIGYENGGTGAGNGLGILVAVKTASATEPAVSVSVSGGGGDLEGAIVALTGATVTAPTIGSVTANHAGPVTTISGPSINAAFEQLVFFVAAAGMGSTNTFSAGPTGTNPVFTTRANVSVNPGDAALLVSTGPMMSAAATGSRSATSGTGSKALAAVQFAINPYTGDLTMLV